MLWARTGPAPRALSSKQMAAGSVARPWYARKTFTAAYFSFGGASVVGGGVPEEPANT